LVPEPYQEMLQELSENLSGGYVHGSISYI